MQKHKNNTELHMIARILALLLFLGLPNFLIAQERSLDIEKIEKKQSLTFVLGHTHVSEGIKDGKEEWLTLPSFGLDYNYMLSPKFSLGLHNDLVIENFKVQKATDVIELERTAPFASALVAGFKPGKSFTYEFGFGGEFAKEGNLFLTRVGIEYSLEISKDLELVSNLVYDIKWRHYNSYVLGIGICRLF
jgi:hypothetical protein